MPSFFRALASRTDSALALTTHPAGPGVLARVALTAMVGATCSVLAVPAVAAVAAPTVAGRAAASVTALGVPVVAGGQAPVLAPTVVDVRAPYQIVTWQTGVGGRPVRTDASTVITVEQADTGTSWSVPAVSAPVQPTATGETGATGETAGAGDPTVTSGALPDPETKPNPGGTAYQGDSAPNGAAPDITTKPDSGVLPEPVPGSCPDSGLPAAAGLTSSGAEVLDCLHAKFPEISTFLGVGYRASNGASDHPSGRAVDAMIPAWDTPDGNIYGWQVARWVELHAAELNVKYIIFDAQIFIPGQGWRAYRHPSGATDANSLHLNHVHVSVRG